MTAVVRAEQAAKKTPSDSRDKASAIGPAKTKRPTKQQAQALLRAFSAEMHGLAASWQDTPSDLQRRRQVYEEEAAKAKAKWTAKGERPEAVEERVERRLRAVSVALDRRRETNAKENLPEAVRFILDAVDEYLSGTADSLDKALGLRRGRGRSSGSGYEGLLLQAFKIHAFEPGKSWKQISEAVGFSGEPDDLRRMIEHHSDAIPRLIADEVRSVGK